MVTWQGPPILPKHSNRVPMSTRVILKGLDICGLVSSQCQRRQQNLLTPTNTIACSIGASPPKQILHQVHEAKEVYITNVQVAKGYSLSKMSPSKPQHAIGKRRLHEQNKEVELVSHHYRQAKTYNEACRKTYGLPRHVIDFHSP